MISLHAGGGVDILASRAVRDCFSRTVGVAAVRD